MSTRQVQALLEGQNSYMQPGNHLLAALNPSTRADVIALARAVSLQPGDILSQPHLPASHVYFLTSGVASFIIAGREGASAEVGMVGCEGVVGSADLLGSYAPMATCVVQMAGTALCVPVRGMRALFEASAEMRGLMLQATQQQLLSAGQIAACNRLHDATQRLARWLLTAADRSGHETVPLTQDALSQMLGTRRTTVAVVAGAMQRGGLISYQRGNISILNRDGLTAAACDCYSINRSLVDALYSTPSCK